MALRPIMCNLFAGIQLASTQPIRIDDAVIEHGEAGNIEEITSTDVVVRIWDKRRMVVPQTYFIEESFENWTREDATLIGTVMIYLDYSVMVDDIRDSLRTFLEQNPLWDRDVFAVQVTDFREFALEIRLLATNSRAPRVFNPRCEIREYLAAWLRATYHARLPQMRRSLNITSSDT